MPETSITANQLVAHNLTRIRKTRGWSQEQAAKQLERYLPGERWSKAVYSAAERGYQGRRVRQFTADDLVAMSLAFDVPLIYFFLPPGPESRTIGTAKDLATGLRAGKADIGWRDLFEVMVGGSHRASVMHRMLELPPGDRPAINSDTSITVRQLALNPPVSLGTMSPPDDDAEAGDEPQ